MSPEQLLFFLLLLAIPLLERLMTAMRGRREASRPGGPNPPTAERIPPGKPVVSGNLGNKAFAGSNAAVLASAPLPDEAVVGNAGNEAVAQSIPGRVLVRAARDRQALPVTALRAAHASQATRYRAIPNAIRASTPTRWVPSSGEDLRIAVVHMAILGPCRALEPRDPSQGA